MDRKSTGPRRAFTAAVRDYASLCDRCYPERALLKIVSDRYRLERWERTALYRGVYSSTRSSARRRARTDRIRGRSLIVDGYNVLYTVCNYLYGRELFLSTDGFLRDAGETYSSAPDTEALLKGIDHLLRFLKRKAPRTVLLLFDAPISHSGELSAQVRKLMGHYELPGTARTERSADRAIKEIDGGVVATSDSGIIDALLSAGKYRFCDLPYLLISREFHGELISLRKIRHSYSFFRFAR